MEVISPSLWRYCFSSHFPLLCALLSAFILFVVVSVFCVRGFLKGLVILAYPFIFQEGWERNLTGNSVCSVSLEGDRRTSGVVWGLDFFGFFLWGHSVPSENGTISCSEYIGQGALHGCLAMVGGVGESGWWTYHSHVTTLTQSPIFSSECCVPHTLPLPPVVAGAPLAAVPRV